MSNEKNVMYLVCPNYGYEGDNVPDMDTRVFHRYTDAEAYAKEISTRYLIFKVYEVVVGE